MLYSSTAVNAHFTRVFLIAYVSFEYTKHMKTCQIAKNIYQDLKLYQWETVIQTNEFEDNFDVMRAFELNSERVWDCFYIKYGSDQLTRIDFAIQGMLRHLYQPMQPLH